MPTPTVVATKPFGDQKPGTSGLRKKVTVFSQPHYLENFVEAMFRAIVKREGTPLKGCTLVVGGDGRYFVQEAVQVIIKMAHAHGVGKLIVGQHGLFSTPAVSCVIRRYHARGGIILTASHNPGGPTEDFGVKYNIANGGPAPESMTSVMYLESKSLDTFAITADLPTVDLSAIGAHQLDANFNVTIVDPVADYLAMMKELFDFDQLRALVSSPSFSIRADCLNGVAGPYARRILVDELGAPAESLVHGTPLTDFGGEHPDPNLTYAHKLVEAMQTGLYDLGVAFDGDADRNMILGKNGFFVTPSDSVAVIAANSQFIPYLAKGGIKGLSRSMPTGAALDRVAAKLGVKCFEVPTGWKFFGNLMDAGLLSVCGEESFGTGSDHIREKDGVWAMLCWLSIMAGRKASIEQILHSHWTEFGRNFFTRYDYENVDSSVAEAVMAHLNKYVAHPDQLTSMKFETGHVVAGCDDFSYTDPTNQEVTAKQGLRILFTDGSRIIFRLSGTGSSGATIRLYVDSYVSDPSQYAVSAQVALKPLVDIALTISKLEGLTGRTAPTVIT